jgi:hypothetical protein
LISRKRYRWPVSQCKVGGFNPPLKSTPQSPPCSCLISRENPKKTHSQSSRDEGRSKISRVNQGNCQETKVAIRIQSPFTVVTVPFPKKEVGQLWKGYFVMPYPQKLNDLHGHPVVNVVSGGTFYIHDKNSSTLPKPLGWLSLKTMEDEINHLLSRAEAKFCTPNGSTRTSKTIGLLVRRHIVAVEFHYIGKEASTRWASGPDLSMMAEAGALDAAHETFREYERVVDPKYLDQIRIEAKQFSTKLLSRQSRVAECAIRNFKNGKNTIRPRTLRKLTKAIHVLQNKNLRN